MLTQPHAPAVPCSPARPALRESRADAAAAPALHRRSCLAVRVAGATLAGAAAAAGAGRPRRRIAALRNWNNEDVSRDSFFAGEAIRSLDQLPLTFSEDGASSSQPACRILCYGDSFTLGYCAGGKRFEPFGRSLARALAQATDLACEVEVSGQNAHSIEQMLDNLDREEVVDFAGAVSGGLRRTLSKAEDLPDLVILLAGSKELEARDVSPEVLCDRMTALHQVCRELGVPAVVVTPLDVPRQKKSDYIQAKRGQLLRLLESWAADANVTVVDSATLVPPGVADGADGVWDWDGFHLAPRGSTILGRRLVPLVLPSLAEEVQRAAEAKAAAVAATLQSDMRGVLEELTSVTAVASLLAEGSAESRPSSGGIESWRSSPAEEADTFLGDIEDDYSRGTLVRGVPLRSLPLLWLDPEVLPGVGQELELRVAEDEEEMGSRFPAVKFAVNWTGGVIACIPEIEGAVGIPRGGTVAEILSVVTLGKETLVKIRGVTGVRLVARHPAQKVDGCTVALLQEVPEWGDAEEELGLASLLQEVKLMAELFKDCGDLQRRSGYTAAGDFCSASLNERAEMALTVLDGVRALRADGQQLETAARAAAAVSHAALGAMAVSMRTKFFVEPGSLLNRMRRIIDFLAKVKGVLGSKLAIDQALNGEN